MNVVTQVIQSRMVSALDIVASAVKESDLNLEDIDSLSSLIKLIYFEIEELEDENSAPVFTPLKKNH